MEGGFQMSMGNFLSTFPLDLETYGFFVLFIDGFKTGLHLVDLFHKRGRNSNRVIANKDSMISNF